MGVASEGNVVVRSRDSSRTLLGIFFWIKRFPADVEAVASHAYLVSEDSR